MPKLILMEYNRIVAVTGLPGLYEIVSSKNDGALVRSLDEGTTKFISSRIHNLSHLESIEVYTTDDNVNLVEIFQAMKANKTAMPDVKDNKALKTYFEKVYPSIDFERVYASDMKKMIKWFESLEKNNIEYKLTEEAEEPAEETAAEPVAATEEVAKPKKTKAASKEEAAVIKETATKPKAAKASAAKEEEAKPKTAKKKKEE
jgi:hypothetical protein